jgi:hypothetical protein
VQGKSAKKVKKMQNLNLEKTCIPYILSLHSISRKCGYQVMSGAAVRQLG